MSGTYGICQILISFYLRFLVTVLEGVTGIIHYSLENNSRKNPWRYKGVIKAWFHVSSCCSFCNEGISLVQCNVCGACSVYTWYYIVYTYLYKNIITAKINTPNIQQIGIIRWSSGQRFVYQQQQNDFKLGRKLLLRNLRNKKESLITSRWSSLPICARIHAKSSDEPL